MANTFNELQVNDKVYYINKDKVKPLRVGKLSKEEDLLTMALIDENEVEYRGFIGPSEMDGYKSRNLAVNKQGIQECLMKNCSIEMKLISDERRMLNEKYHKKLNEYKLAYENI